MRCICAVWETRCGEQSYKGIKRESVVRGTLNSERKRDNKNENKKATVEMEQGSSDGPYLMGL